MATIPGEYTDLLEKPVFWHIATIGPGDERVIMVVEPEHTTQMG